MKALRHVIRAFELTQAVAARGWDWSRLLHDIDVSLRRFYSRLDGDRPATIVEHVSDTHEDRGGSPTKRAKLGGSQAQAIEKAAWEKLQDLNIQPGVELYYRYSKKQLRGVVQQVCHGKAMAKVHYMGWPAYYDEYQPLEALQLADDSEEGRKAGVNDSVLVSGIGIDGKWNCEC